MVLHLPSKRGFGASCHPEMQRMPGRVGDRLHWGIMTATTDCFHPFLKTALNGAGERRPKSSGCRAGRVAELHPSLLSQHFIMAVYKFAFRLFLWWTCGQGRGPHNGNCVGGRWRGAPLFLFPSLSFFPVLSPLLSLSHSTLFLSVCYFKSIFNFLFVVLSFVLSLPLSFFESCIAVGRIAISTS